jgi:hypothetical protein
LAPSYDLAAKVDVLQGGCVPQTIEWQGDILSFAVDAVGVLVSGYIAFLLHRLTRRFSENEAIRSINHGWDSLHKAMLDKETHDLFWNWVRSEAGFEGLGDRAHHIVLMYLNNIHTEYSTWKGCIFPDASIEYIDVLLKVFIKKRTDLVLLAVASGYEREFLVFLRQRLDLLAAQ